MSAMEKNETAELAFDLSYNDALQARSRGDWCVAVEQFGQALELARGFGEDDERFYNSLVGLARCHYRLGNNAMAEAHYRWALDVMENHLSERDPTRLASILWELAILCTEQSRFKEAILFFEQSMEVTEQSGGQDRFVADCLWGLSKCLCALGQLPAAESAIGKALLIYQKSSEDVTEFIMTNLGNLATIQTEQGKYKEAAKTLEQIVEIKEKNDDRDPALIPLYCQLAWCFKKRDHFKDAERVLRRAHTIAKYLAPESAQSALLEVTMAHNYNMQKQYVKAETLLKKAIKTLSRPVAAGVAAGQCSPDSGEILTESFTQLGSSTAASEAEADVCGAIFELSMVYINQSKFKEALERLEHLLAIHERSPLANPELFADTLFQLGLCCEKLIQYRKAKFYFERAVTIRERLYGYENEEVAGALFKLSKCLQKLDEYADARMVQQQAEEIMKQLRSRS